MSEMTRKQVEFIAAWIGGPTEEDMHGAAETLLAHDSSQRQRIAQLEAEVGASRQQETAWRLAFEGLERQHKALTDQIPADMIQADPILVERVTVAAAMEEIGRQQIADLQAEVNAMRTASQLTHFILEHPDGDYDKTEQIQAEAERYGLEKLFALKAEVARLKEWKLIIEGTGTDQEAVIRMAAAEYTKVAVQCWKDKVEQLEAQITYLQTISTEQVERIRALEPKDWTEEKPTVPGWYWFKEMSKNGVVMGVSVLQLKWEEPYGKDREYGGYFYDAETDLTLDELRGQWSGPIEKPKGESS